MYIAEDVAHFMALFGCYCKVPREGSFRVAGPSTITSVCYQLGPTPLISRSSLMRIIMRWIVVI